MSRLLGMPPFRFDPPAGRWDRMDGRICEKSRRRLFRALAELEVTQ